MQSLITTILDSTLIVEVLAVIIASLKCSNTNEKPQRRLLIYMGLFLIVEIIAFTMNKLNVPNNQWLYNLFGVIEVWLLFSIINTYITKSYKRIIKFLLILSYIAIIINALFFSTPFLMEYFNYGFAIYSALICIACFMLLYDLLRSDDVLEIHRHFSFWFVLGVVIYNLCKMPLAIISNIYQELFTYDSPVILIQPISFLLMYVCFIIGYLWSKDTNYSST